MSAEDSSASSVEEDDDNEEETPAPTAEDIVLAGIERGQFNVDTCNVPIDSREIDEVEERVVRHYAVDGCKCDFGPKQSPCCKSISVEHYRSARCHMEELTHDELDLVVMAQVMAGCSTGKNLSRGNDDRNHSHTTFHHHGIRICQKTFLFLHGIGYWRFKAIKASYLSDGLTTRCHGNKGRKHKKGLKLQEVKDVVQFIMNYAGTCTVYH